MFHVYVCTVAGCTDESACNYDSSATDNDDSCVYAEEYYDCDGACITDSDGDGICDEQEGLMYMIDDVTYGVFWKCLKSARLQLRTLTTNVSF